MQIVIDISKETYDELVRYGEPLPSGNTFYDQILNAVAQGTPLPKGHGRLIAEPTEEDIAKTVGGQNDFAESEDK